MNAKTMKNIPVLPMLKCLLCSYLLTTALLLLLAFFLYQFRWPETIVHLSILAIYTIASFLGGFLAGKCMLTRRFVWGLILGCAYYLILLGLSFFSDPELPVFSSDSVSAFFLCAAAGTLGGMLS